MKDGEGLVQRTFADAFKECGDDPRAIARWISERVKNMSPEDRALFNGVAEAASSFDGCDGTAKPKKLH